jgi:hypothetical protein
MTAIFTRSFWAYAGERAIKTSAQTALAVIGVNSLDLLSADWTGIVSAAIGGAVLSVLTSVATSDA